jgi:hypothetical protein
MVQELRAVMLFKFCQFFVFGPTDVIAVTLVDIGTRCQSIVVLKEEKENLR